MRTIKFRAWVEKLQNPTFQEWYKKNKSNIDRTIGAVKHYEEVTGLKFSEGFVSGMDYDVHLSPKGHLMELDGGWDYQDDNKSAVIMQFTGFADKHGKEIFDGDILSDWTKTDQGMIQSKMQVFWCGETGAWRLDNSFKQDKSSGDLLSDELADCAYEITGNIYENPNFQPSQDKKQNP